MYNNECEKAWHVKKAKKEQADEWRRRLWTNGNDRGEGLAWEGVMAYVYVKRRMTKPAQCHKHEADGWREGGRAKKKKKKRLNCKNDGLCLCPVVCWCWCFEWPDIVQPDYCGVMMTMTVLVMFCSFVSCCVYSIEHFCWYSSSLLLLLLLPCWLQIILLPCCFCHATAPALHCHAGLLLLPAIQAFCLLHLLPCLPAATTALR